MADENFPPEKDVKDFRYQQLCKVRVFDRPDSLPPRRVNLIVSSSKYGLTFVGTNNGFKVLQTSQFMEQDVVHMADRLTHIITDFPLLATVDLGCEVTHLALSCDDLTLAVATTGTANNLLHVYDVRSFESKVISSVAEFLKVNLGSADQQLLGLAWNPVLPGCLVTCLSSGRLEMYDITDKLTIKATVASSSATCVCWSPKGKQLVVGRSDGTLVQYDPELKEKRKWDYPSILPDTSHQAFDIVWLSTYTFLVAYISSDADSSVQPSLILINGSKDGSVSYVNFEDVCYGTGEERQRAYYFNFMQKWDMVLAGSSNASEIGIIGRHLSEKLTWERWNLDDAARAECPLTEEYVDTFPLGFTVDFSSQKDIPIGDERTHGPSPLLLVLTTDGVIVPYHMIYTHVDAPNLTAPVERLNTAGLRKPIAGSSTQPTSTPTIGMNLFGSLSTSGQTAAKPLFGAGLSSASTGQSATTSLFGAGLSSASTGQSATTSLFGAGQSSASTCQTATTSLFGAGQSSALTGQATTTPLFGAGQSPASSGQSVAKSLFGAGSTSSQAFSFTPTMTTAAPTGGFSFAASTPSFGQKAPVTASGPSALGVSSGAGSISSGFTCFGLSGAQDGGLSLAPKTTPSLFVKDVVGETKPPAVPTQTAAATSGFNFTTGTTSAAPLFGSSSTPAGTASTAAPSTGTKFGGAPAFGSTPAPAFALSASTTASTGSSFSFGAGSTATPSFGSSASSGATTATSKTGPPAFGSLTGSSAPKFAIAATTISAAGTTSPALTSTLSDSSTASTGFGLSAGTTPGFMFGGVGASAPSAQGVSIGMVSKPSASSAAPALPAASQEALPKVPRASTEAPPPAYQVPRSPTEAPPPAYRVPRSPTEAPPPAYKVSQDATDALDSTFTKSILEEMQHFSQELAESRTRSSSADYYIGSSDDMKMLRTQAQDLELFSVEIKTSLQEQSKDVQDLSSMCLDMFAMAEECQSREQQHQDPRYHHLLRNCALHPASAEKLADLRLQYQVLDQGLRDVDLVLDTQWEEYQNRKQRSANRLRTPTNDAIYRAVKSNHNVILAQKTKLRELEERLKQLKVYNRTNAWQNLNSTAELSTLADSLVSSSPARGSRSVGEPVDKLSDSMSVQRCAGSGRFNNSNRLIRLRRHLERTCLPVLRTTKPENLSMSRLVVPEPTPRAATVRAPADPTAGLVNRSSEMRPAQTGGAATFTQPQQQIQRPVQLPAAGTLPTAQHTTMSASQPGTMFSSQLGKMPGTQPGTKAGTQPGSMFGSQQSKLPATQPGGTAPSSVPGTFSGSLAGKVSGTGTLPAFGGFGGGSSGSVSIGNKPASVPMATAMSKTTALRDPGVSSSSSAAATTAGASAAKQAMFKPDMAPIGKPSFLASSKYEDITPSGSENEVGETEEEEEEYDEEESGDDYPGLGMTSTPLAVPKVTLTGQSSHEGGKNDGSSFAAGVSTTPVSRKLFVSGESKVPETIKFGTEETAGGVAPFTLSSATSTASSSTPGFSFGSQSSAANPDTTTTNLQSGFSFGSNSTMPSLATLGAKSSNQSPTTGSDAAPASFKFGGPASTVAFGGKTSAQSSSAAATSINSATTTASSLSKPGFGLFGQAASASNTTATATTGSSAGTVTGQRVTATAATSDSGSTGDPPGSKSGTSVSMGGLFGQASSATATTTASSAGLFGKPAASTGLFGQASTGLSFGGTSSSGSLFGSSTSTPSTSSGGLFGQSAPSTASSGGMFGQTTTSTASSGGLFGQSPASTSSSGGLFGQSTTSTASSGGLFGKSPASTASSGGLFGQSTTSTASSGGLFGQSPASTTSSGGLFGQSTTSTASSGGLFGKSPATTASSGGLFGQSTTSTPSSGGLFGQSSTATSGGLFGQSSTTTSTGPVSLFGQSAPASASTAPLFGQTTTSTSSSGGLFGQSSISSSGGLFGQANTTSASTGLFGQSSTSTASSGGLFGQSSMSTPSSGGLFGQPASGSGVFGSSGSGFGTSTSGAGVGFGETASSSPGFGKPAFGQSTGGFGQTASSPFGQSNQESGGGGGGMFSGLGGKPSAEKANTNVFGTSQTFGTGQQNSGLFGGGSSGTFGNSPTPTTSASAGFSSGAGVFSGTSGVGATGFGTAQPSSGAGGFGSPPAFGGAPAFGSPPKFGSTPAFGSGGAGGGGFGSAPVFGSSQPSGTFGSAAAGTAGFAGFASAGSPTFGALAQANDVPTFGGISQTGTGEGFGQTGGFGQATGGFGQQTGGFGSPSFGQQQSPPAFGGNTFGSSPSFTGYRG